MADFSQLTAHYWAPIRPLLDEPGVADICIDRHDFVYTSGKGGYREWPDAVWKSEADLRAAVANLASTVNKNTLDAEHPILDTRLPDGSRVNASIPPLSANTQVTIRVARPVTFTLEQLAEGGMFDAAMRGYFLRALEERRNIVISGSTNSGKTTLLRAFGLQLVDRERFYIVEDTAELRLPIRRGVVHEVSANNRASLSMEDSLRAALRSAPDRMFVGEIRTSSALQTYLEVLEVGFTGALTTLHARSAIGAVQRCESLLHRTGMFGDYEAYAALVRANIDTLIHCERCEDGRYRVTQVVEVEEGGAFVSLFTWSGDGWRKHLAH